MRRGSQFFLRAAMISAVQVSNRAQSSSSTSGAAAEATEQVNKETISAKEEKFEPPKFASRSQNVMDSAAAARREIFELWRNTSDVGKDEARVEGVSAILAKYKLDMTTPREDDICFGLGDALDRLLLLCVPFNSKGDTTQLEQVLHVAARQGRQLSIRTVQHLFARTSSFAEALGVFYALRKAHISMSMETYHAMLYSLQRLEEEGWAQRFNEEFEASGRREISEKALDFIIRGVDNQLIPESKPWLGRVMFADADNTAAIKQTRESYDSLNKAWVDRYKKNGSM